MTIRKGETASGFKFKVNDEILDDMELVDALAAVDSGRAPLEISRVVEKVLGDDKQALYEHLRTKKGNVPVSEVANAIVEIFEALGDEGKNS